MQIQIAKIRPILNQEVLRIRDRLIVQVHHTLLDRVLHLHGVLPAIAGLQAFQLLRTVHHPEVLQLLHMEEVAQVAVRLAVALQAEVQEEAAQAVVVAVLVTEDNVKQKNEN